ncbi:MAG TPA: PDDEXK nuclease domain-containing protein [Ideonella sp.]|uniref:PDDEXK nuclease domain-containing protein n=1 Tax=Ideonella sp. TaxID=1929293 RepID=UPI002C2614CC|nr:PDDEXK nuclease domain-containing protein [Ideonella sp.]HSI50645.1 PDDEXK nuclease domain-containing protein [Ideonella sp.]
MPADTQSFEGLVAAIAQAHTQLTSRAAKAVNVSLTLRNWVIGFYIHVYEQAGADRARYGERLLESLTDRLRAEGLARVDVRELRRFRHFYVSYPQIRETLSPEFTSGLALPPAETAKRETASPVSAAAGAPANLLLERLAFSHFAELLQLDDAQQRAFYEIETLRGNWSVRELKRQIATQYYQRSGLSSQPGALAALTQAEAQSRQSDHPAAAFIRDPYVFEFLGLKPQEAVTEGDLEDALLDKLQSFLLELGHGFCFEARQKRLLIGGEHFFVDLVFYHRVLKCHVLIELKNDAFRHEHLGQLNAYVSYFQKHEMTAGDQPPIGILLCTAKNHELVEFALAGMTNQLFVSRYQLQLPDKAQMAAFLQQALRELQNEPPT